MALDAFKNLAYSTVLTAPSPAASGTSLVVAAGTGPRFPAVPFNATVWPTGTMPDPTTAEIVRVTGISTDTLTITRTQEGTSARTIIAGDQIAQTFTVLALDTLSAQIATASALATTADTHANTVSAAVTIASALATTADAHANTVSAAVTIASALATTADTHANTVSAAVTIASALATTADTHANTVSAAVTVASALATTADAHANTVSAQLVSVSAAITAAIQVASAAANTVSAQLVSVSAALTATVNVVSAQLVSVSAALTAAIQVASAAATSADGHANTVSVNVVGRAPWISAVYAIVANSQTINTSAIAGVSALTFAVAANSLWEFEGMVIASVSAVAAGLLFGTSVSGGLAAGPRFMYVETVQGTVNPQSAVGALRGFGLIGQSGLTTILSCTSIASAGLAFPIWFNGTVQASASGNVQIAAGGIASTAASPLVILAGSYIKAFRLS